MEVGELRGARRRTRIPHPQECGAILRGAFSADPQGYAGSAGGAAAIGSAGSGGGSPPGERGERDRSAPRRIAEGSAGGRRAPVASYGRGDREDSIARRTGNRVRGKSGAHGI